MSAERKEQDTVSYTVAERIAVVKSMYHAMMGENIDDKSYKPGLSAYDRKKA